MKKRLDHLEWVGFIARGNQLYSYPKDRSDYIGLLSLLGEIDKEHLILMDHIYTILEN